MINQPLIRLLVLIELITHVATLGQLSLGWSECGAIQITTSHNHSKESITIPTTHSWTESVSCTKSESVDQFITRSSPSLHNNKLIISTINQQTGGTTARRAIPIQPECWFGPVSGSGLGIITRNQINNQLAITTTCNTHNLECVNLTHPVPVDGNESAVWIGRVVVYVAGGKLGTINLDKQTSTTTNTYQSTNSLTTISPLSGDLGDEYFVGRDEADNAHVFTLVEGEPKLIATSRAKLTKLDFVGYRGLRGEGHVIYRVVQDQANLILEPLRTQLETITIKLEPSWGRVEQVTTLLDPRTESVAVGVGYSSGLVQLHVGLNTIASHQFGISNLDLGPVLVPRQPISSLPLADNNQTNSISNRLFSLIDKSTDRAIGTSSRLAVAGSSSHQTIYGLHIQNHSAPSNWALHLGGQGKVVKLRSLQIDEGLTPVGTVIYDLHHSSAHSTRHATQFDPTTGQRLNTNPIHLDTELDSIEVNPTGIKSKEWTYSVPKGWTTGEWYRSGPIKQMASVGRVLGDRTTLFKYFNPNLLALVTLNHSYKDQARVILIDSTSGKVVNEIRLVDVVLSTIKLAIKHNSIIITATLFNQLGQATIIHSFQLFTNKPDLSLLSRSFISPDGLTIAAQTETDQQITTTNSIFLTPRGLLVSVPGRVLDPRRTYSAPTSQDQEELLLKYEPIISIDHRWVLSPLHPFDSVISVGGDRESISVVVASGQAGVIALETSPSRTFDLLSHNFNKTQLVFTISILTIALLVTRKLVGNRQVRHKWYSSM